MRKTIFNKVKFSLGMAMSLALLAGCVPSTSSTQTTQSTANAASSESGSTESSAGETSAAESASSEQALGANTDSAKAKIAVVQLVEHTSLNIIKDAIMDELNVQGYVDGENAVIDFKNAQGEMTNITTIMQNYEGNKQDVIIGIATPVAQGAMSLTKTTPVIFSAVTDPIGAGLVTDLNTTDKGMTGTSDAVQVDRIMELAMKITPKIKTIGYIYNPGEDNSVYNLGLLKEFANANDLTVVEAGISTSAELQTAASTLLPKVDAIFVANDNTVASAMPVLAQEANKAKKPVYVGADSMVMDGGFATVGIDYEELGRESARQAVEVLKGKDVSEIPVKVFKDDLFIYVNTDTAAAIGIELPAEITGDAKYVEIKN